MIELLFDPQAWIALATLTILEIVLGIDNIIFLSITTARLPSHLRVRAQRIGLFLALIMRIIFLMSITWIIGMTAPIFTIGSYTMSWRDLVLLLGGLFLLTKATREIHGEMEGEHEKKARAGSTTFTAVILQIIVIDLVFSIDSVITAIGMVDSVIIMVTAVTISIIVMMLAAEPVSAFVMRHPTVKMLALSFLILIGVALIADGMHFHIPRGYLYFAIAFSAMVELFNLRVAKRRARKA